MLTRQSTFIEYDTIENKIVERATEPLYDYLYGENFSEYYTQKKSVKY